MIKPETAELPGDDEPAAARAGMKCAWDERRTASELATVDAPEFKHCLRASAEMERT